MGGPLQDLHDLRKDVSSIFAQDLGRTAWQDPLEDPVREGGILSKTS